MLVFEDYLKIWNRNRQHWDGKRRYCIVSWPFSLPDKTTLPGKGFHAVSVTTMWLYIIPDYNPFFGAGVHLIEFTEMLLEELPRKLEISIWISFQWYNEIYMYIICSTLRMVDICVRNVHWLPTWNGCASFILGSSGGMTDQVSTPSV